MNEQALIAEARRSLSGATGFIYTRALAERLLSALVEAHERIENLDLEYEYADDGSPDGTIHGQARRVVGPWEAEA